MVIHFWNKSDIALMQAVDKEIDQAKFEKAF